MPHLKFKVFPWLLCGLVFCGGCGSSPSDSAAAPSTTSPTAAAVGSALARTLSASEFRVDFSITSDWGSGFGASLNLINTSTAALDDWTLEFDFPYHISTIWNARIVSHVGNHYTLAPESWNRGLAPGASVAIGFNGDPGAVKGTPTGYVLNAGAPAASPSPAPTTSPSPAPTTALRYVVDNDWGSGFTGHIEVPGPAQNWVIEFDWDRQLSSVWNGKIASHVGTHYQIQAADYNRAIAAGSSVSVGFQGSPGSGAGPTNLRLQGAASPSPSPSPTVSPTPAPVGTGWLGTRGSQIVDSQEKTVRLTGVNWFGLETSDYAPHGLWSRNLDDMVNQMSQLGYNCIRLPYSNQLFEAPATPNINYSLNPKLVGLSGVQLIDQVVASAGAHDMKVILDRHRPEASGQSELWYTSQHSEERWISDWEMLARRYRNNPTVIGCDLHNEPHGAATWGDGNAATDWRAAATRAGNRILAVNPNLLILVEGVENVGGDAYWWGGNLKAAGQSPVQLNLSGRVVYSPHDYPSSVFSQTWFSAPNYPNNLNAVWESHWGYLARTGVAPVLVGEFGTKYQTASDRGWLNQLVPYVSNLGLSFTYWSWNPNSGDTGGILQDDWKSVNLDKQAVLNPSLAPRF